MKRTVSVVLAVVLSLALLFSCVPVSAAESIEISADTVTADLNAGDPVSVPVKFVDNVAYLYGSVTAEWDPDALELTGIDYTDLAPKPSEPLPITNTGSYKISFGDREAAAPFEGSGIAFTLNFAITDSAAAGDYAIALSEAALFSADSSELTVTRKEGQITLTEADHMHSLTPHEKTDPDCENDGHEAYWECEGCGALFSDEAGENSIEAPVVIPALQHKWDKGVVKKEPSCSESGLILYTCQNDPEHTKTKAIKPTEHSLTHVPAKAATKTAAGNKAYYVCSECGKYFRDSKGKSEITDPNEVVISPLKQQKAKTATTAKKKTTA